MSCVKIIVWTILKALGIGIGLLVVVMAIGIVGTLVDHRFGQLAGIVATFAFIFIAIGAGIGVLECRYRR